MECFKMTWIISAVLFPAAVSSFSTHPILTTYPSISTDLCEHIHDSDHGIKRTKNNVKQSDFPLNRRVFLQTTSVTLVGLNYGTPVARSVEDDTKSLKFLLSQVEQAKAQLEPIPAMIRDEKWDTIRSILSTPPLSACWTKTGQTKPLLQKYADAIGKELPDGDEFAALEGKEDAISHLRYLDMSAYNNVFNPIKTVGTAGATKELVRSYYEDPKMEFDASLKALSDLVKLGQ